MAAEGSSAYGEALDEHEVEQALAHARGSGFRLAHLEALLAPLPRAKGADEDVLAGWPRPMPLLLRAAVGRAAELGGRDVFGVLPLGERRRVSAAFDDEVLVFARTVSDPGSGGASGLWVLEAEGLAEVDPLVTFHASKSAASRGPVAARLSSWVQAHAIETRLLRRAELTGAFVTGGQVAHVAATLAAACGDVTVDGASPWLVHLRASARQAT